MIFLSGATFPNVPKTEARVGQAGLDATTAALAISYAKFKLPWFELLLGKENLSWGPGRHGALFISDNPLPMNMVKLSAWYKQIKFSAFTSILGNDIGKKYMSGHRLEFNLWDKVSLGICENIVYGNRFETIYTNPFQIYAVTEIPSKIVEGESVESPDNVLVSGDLDIFLLKNLEFYGELLMDDFYPNYGLRSPFNWGSKLGILLGFYYVNPFSIPDAEGLVSPRKASQKAIAPRTPRLTFALNIHLSINTPTLTNRWIRPIPIMLLLVDILPMPNTPSLGFKMPKRC